MNLTTVPAHHILTPPPGQAVGSREILQSVAVVVVEGDIDLHTGPALRRALADLLHPRAEVHRGGGVARTAPQTAPGADGLSVPVRALIIDLTDVEFIDSYALGVLVQGHHLARRSGVLYALVATHPMIHTLFAVTGLSKVLPLHPDVTTAVAELSLTDPSTAV